MGGVNKRVASRELLRQHPARCHGRRSTYSIPAASILARPAGRSMVQPLVETAGRRSCTRHHPAPQARVPVPQVERLAERLGARERRGPGVDGVLSDPRRRDGGSAVAARAAADPQTSLPRGGRARLLAAAHRFPGARQLRCVTRPLLLAGRDVLVGPGHGQQEAVGHRAAGSPAPGRRSRPRSRTRRAPRPTSRAPASRRLRTSPREGSAGVGPSGGPPAVEHGAAAARRRPPGLRPRRPVTRTCLRLYTCDAGPTGTQLPSCSASDSRRTSAPPTAGDAPRPRHHRRRHGTRCSAPELPPAARPRSRARPPDACRACRTAGRPPSTRARAVSRRRRARRARRRGRRRGGATRMISGTA